MEEVKTNIEIVYYVGENNCFTMDEDYFYQYDFKFINNLEIGDIVKISSIKNGKKAIGFCVSKTGVELANTNDEALIISRLQELLINDNSILLEMIKNARKIKGMQKTLK